MQNPGHLPPALPPSHYLDNRIFTDPSIFREEQERLFSKVWQFVCHESELPNSGDFRTTQVAGKPLKAQGDLVPRFQFLPTGASAFERPTAFDAIENGARYSQ